MNEPKEKIIIADDAEINRVMLRDIFEEQYEIIEAEDGEEVLDVIRENPDAKLLLLDLMMPKKNGLEVLENMAENHSLDNIPVIMITSENSERFELNAYEYGVSEVAHKPFNSQIILRRAQNIIELNKQRKDMANEIRKKNRALMESHKCMEANNKLLITALGSVVEFRSSESGEHVVRVREYTRIILEHVRDLYPEYKLTKNQIDEMSQAAILHDIGKIAIPDTILNKPGRLTDEEFTTMKTHTLRGCEILDRFRTVESETSFFQYCYEITRWHHERDDGRGYPDGLSGESIPIYAQASGVADCFDALVSKRVYKEPFSKEEAFRMIINGECGKFSKKLLDSFEAARKEIFAVADSHVDDTKKNAG